MADDFYIGYLEKASERTRRPIRVFVATVFFLLVALGLWIAFWQPSVEKAEFEFGKLTTIEGILITEPVPMLLIPDRAIMLIGYGKHGAQSAIEEAGLSNGSSVKVEGTLIYRDGKTLMELTKRSKAFLGPSDVRLDPLVSRHRGAVELQGEIIDPKCYFGVMRPGEGKTHRSCAIRCISGGIPPVLATRSPGPETNYFILRGPDGEAINEQILNWVGKQVTVRGNLEEWGDWFVLRVDPQDISKQAISPG